MIKIRKSRIKTKKENMLFLDTSVVPNAYYVKTVYEFKVQVRILCFWVTIKTFADDDAPEYARNEAEEFLDKYNEKI